MVTIGAVGILAKKGPCRGLVSRPVERCIQYDEKTGRKVEMSSDFISLGFWGNRYYSSCTLVLHRSVSLASS